MHVKTEYIFNFERNFERSRIKIKIKVSKIVMDRCEIEKSQWKLKIPAQFLLKYKLFQNYLLR